MHDRLDESFSRLLDRFDSFQAAYMSFREKPQTTTSREELSNAHMSLLQALEEFQQAMYALHEPVLGDIAAETLSTGQDGHP